jgi:copper transport protein
MKVRRNFFLLIGAIFVFLFSYPSFPSAHAYIFKSVPSENEILGQPPPMVSIQFDETIQPSFNSIKVFDSNGKQVDQKNGRIDPNNASIIETDMNGNLSNGTYSIQWKVVSGDGHPVEGVIPFQIGKGNKQASPLIVQKSKGYIPHGDLIIIRWLQYLSNACFVGILFFYLFVLPKELVQDIRVKTIYSKLIIYSFTTLCFSIVLGLPLQATIESGLSWGKVLNTQVLGELLTNSVFGKTWITQIIMMLILWFLTFLLCYKPFNKQIWVWISLTLGIGMLRTKTFTGHAASSENGALSIGMDLFHLLSASIWIGSLIALIALIPLGRKAETKKVFMETIRRFSKWGIIIVLVLSVTGVYSSLLYIPNFRSLLITDYGRALSGKVLLLLIMVVFAAVNFIKGRRSSEKGLAGTMWGELITGIIVLVLSVILTNLPTAMASPGPVKDTNKVGHGNTITFEATPNVIGNNTFVVSLKDRNGHLIKNIDQVTLTFNSLDMPMGDDTITLTKGKQGKYESNGMNFNMAGRWKVKVHVLTQDLETMDTDFKVLVGSQYK